MSGIVDNSRQITFTVIPLINNSIFISSFLINNTASKMISVDTKMIHFVIYEYGSLNMVCSQSHVQQGNFHDSYRNYIICNNVYLANTNFNPSLRSGVKRETHTHGRLLNEKLSHAMGKVK